MISGSAQQEGRDQVIEPLGLVDHNARCAAVAIGGLCGFAEPPLDQLGLPKQGGERSAQFVGGDREETSRACNAVSATSRASRSAA